MLTFLTRWSRSDDVITRGVLQSLLLIVPLVGLGPAILDWVRGQSFLTTVHLDRDEPLPAGLARAHDGATLTWDGTTTVELAHPGTGVRVTDLLANTVLVALVVIGVVVLLQLVADIQANRPFSERGVRCLRILAVLVLVGACVLPVLFGMVESAVIHEGIVDLKRAGAFFSLIPFGVALVLMLLAEAFRQGQKLADDVDGLV